MTAFLQNQLKIDDIWGPLRKNFKTEELFVKACAERVDGLRILQFLKSEHLADSSDRNFAEFCTANGIALPQIFSFENSTINDLNALRNVLYDKEMLLRKQRR